MKINKLFTLFAIVATFVSGCELAKDAMPEVNDENCNDARIAEIKNSDVQQEFATQCALRGSFKPSSGQKW